MTPRRAIRVTDSIWIHDSEIQQRFVRASGPGGQNVNKVATAVQLRFNVRNSPSLPEDVRRRLVRLAGTRINTDGVLILRAGRYRTRERNRRDAVERLIGWIRAAAEKPKTRRPTKPTAASRTRRRQAKQRRGQAKRMRQAVQPTED